MTTTINMIDYPNRLLTAEVWNYGEANLTASGAVKAAPGILGVAQVVTAGSGSVTFYDDPDSANGTILGILPLDVAGVQIYFRRPAINGVYAKFSVEDGTGVVAVGYL